MDGRLMFVKSGHGFLLSINWGGRRILFPIFAVNPDGMCWINA